MSHDDCDVPEDGKQRVIHCLKLFLAPESQGTEATEDGDNTSEQAGCTIWDKSADEHFAALLVSIDALDTILHIVAQCQVAHAESSRRLEISIGILSNICCFTQYLTQWESWKAAFDKIITSLLVCEDAAVLSEACRFISLCLNKIEASKMPEWEALEKKALPAKLVWIACSTLNSMLLQRCLDCASAMCAAYGCTAAQRLLQLGVQEQCAVLLSAYATCLKQLHGVLPDDEAVQADEQRHVTADVCAATIHLLQAIQQAQDEEASTALDGDLAALIFDVLQWEEPSSSVYSAAVIVIAASRCTPPADTWFFTKTMELAMDCDPESDEHAACWYLLAKSSRLMSEWCRKDIDVVKSAITWVLDTPPEILTAVGQYSQTIIRHLCEAIEVVKHGAANLDSEKHNSGFDDDTVAAEAVDDHGSVQDVDGQEAEPCCKTQHEGSALQTPNSAAVHTIDNYDLQFLLQSKPTLMLLRNRNEDT